MGAAGDGFPGERVGAVDEREGGEDGAGFAELDVDGRLAAALGGVVHAGKIVEEERGGVEVFERDAEFGGVGGRKVVGGEHAGDDLGTDEAAGIAEDAVERLTQVRFGLRRERKVCQKSVSQLLMVVIIHGVSCVDFP